MFALQRKIILAIVLIVINLIIKRKNNELLEKKLVVFYKNLTDKALKNILIRIILFLDRKFFGASQVIEKLIDFEENIPTMGIQKAADNLLSHFFIKPIIKSNFYPNEFKEGPVMFIGMNHNLVIEPAVISSIIPRDDIYLIGNKTFEVLGGNVSRHVLPVIQKKYAVDYKETNNKKRYRLLTNPITTLYSSKKLTLKETAEINANTFHEAVEKLNENSAIIIFPTGRNNIDSPWRKGVGEIISRIPKEIRGNVKLIPIFITGISLKDVLKGIKANNGEIKTIDIFFGRIIPLEEIYTGLSESNNPITISSLLRKKMFSEMSIFFPSFTGTFEN